MHYGHNPSSLVSTSKGLQALSDHHEFRAFQCSSNCSPECVDLTRQLTIVVDFARLSGSSHSIAELLGVNNLLQDSNLHRCRSHSSLCKEVRRNNAKWSVQRRYCTTWRVQILACLQEGKDSLKIEFWGRISLGHQGPRRQDMPGFGSGRLGFGKLYARKLWVVPTSLICCS